MPNDPQHAKDIFLDLLELPPEEHEAHLDSACGGDETLLRRVRDLYQAHHAAAGWLPVEPRTPSEADMAGLGQRFQAGDRIGTYRLVGVLGEGGFGTVYRAEQRIPVARSAALKVLKPGLASGESLARFEEERQVLARMEHPGIARVFDAGFAEGGAPWYAMELIDGEPITDYCKNRALSNPARLSLFQDVCRAVQHAHQKGVIHRDLKPTNVLVAEVDGKPVPKIIDFGIAKAMDRKSRSELFVTQAGAMVGTPTYMSPEQANGSQDIDTRADVYSLGVLLYELMSGRRPFEDDALRGAGIAGMYRMIVELEPPRPSQRIARIAETSSGVDRRALRTQVQYVSGDLDWIAMRALSKDPERRYDSAGLLADDVSNFLAGAPVLAGPPDLSYRARKFVRRHRLAISFAALTLVLIVAGAGTAAALAVRAHRAERHAEGEALRASIELAKFEQTNELLSEILRGVDPAVAAGRDDTLLMHLLGRASHLIADQPELAPEVEASVRETIGLAYFSLARHAEAEPHLRGAYEQYSASLGPEDPVSLAALNSWASILLHDGRLDEADAPVLDVYEARARLLGPEHADTLESLGNLATLRMYQGDLSESRELFDELEAQRLRNAAEDPLDAVISINNHAMLLGKLGLVELKLEKLELVLEIQERELSPDHPRLAMALNNLASTYQELGRGEEAEVMLRRSLEIKARVLPPAHPSLLVARNNHGTLLMRAGRPAEALAELEGALAIGVAEHGWRLDQTLGLGFNLAIQYDSLGMVEAALELARKAEREYRDVKGEEHPHTRQLGVMLRDLEGRLATLPSLEELALEVASHGPSSVGLAGPGPGLRLLRRGRELLAEERPEEALEILVPAYELLELAEARDFSIQALEALIEASGALDALAEEEAWRAVLAELQPPPGGD